MNADVGLVAEHRGRHDLDAVGLGRLHRGGDGVGVGERPDLAEQVEDAPPDGGRERLRHGREATGRLVGGSTSTVTTAL